MTKINNWLKSNFTNIILYFLILSPVFDLITSIFLNVLKIEFNFIIIIKILFMFICIYYLFFISKTKYKKISIVTILLIFAYLFLFSIITIKQKDYSVLVYELQNTIRNFFFPITLISIFNIYEENKLNINKKHLSIILLAYILLLFIPIITKTDFSSYAYSKTGSIGWFNSTNEISAIISILLPFGIMELYKMKNIFFKIIITLISIFTYFYLGTKVPILSLFIVIFVYLIKYLLEIFKKRQIKKIITLILSTLIVILSMILLIPKTSFYKNIKIHLEFLQIEKFSDILNIKTIDHFIFSERISFYIDTKNNYQKSSLAEKLFGLGYIENYATDSVKTKTIEMDYYDILFRNGIIGFTLFFGPYITLLYNIYKKQKNYRNLDSNLSIILILILSLFSGHVITSPSVSFIALIILIITLKGEQNEKCISYN